MKCLPLYSPRPTGEMDAPSLFIQNISANSPIAACGSAQATSVLSGMSNEEDFDECRQSFAQRHPNVAASKGTLRLGILLNAQDRDAKCRLLNIKGGQCHKSCTERGYSREVTPQDSRDVWSPTSDSKRAEVDVAIAKCTNTVVYANLGTNTKA